MASELVSGASSASFLRHLSSRIGLDGFRSDPADPKKSKCSTDPKFEGPGLGAFDAGPGGPIYLAYWVGPEIYLADFEIYLADLEIYLADFEIYFAGCVCTGDDGCCATSHNSSSPAFGGARRFAPRLLLWLVAQQQPSPVQTQRAR